MFKKIAFAALTAVTVSALAQSTNQTTTTTTNNNQGISTAQQTAASTAVQLSPDASWGQKYDSYHIGSTDLNSIGQWDMHRILRHNLRDVSACDTFAINSFLDRLSPDQEHVIVKALVNNYKQACSVRDEVAMARFGTDQTYAWLNYPPLAWTDTPGQNSWSTLTFSDTGSTTTVAATTGPLDDAVAMTDDQSRPMRMLMSNRMVRSDIDYDRAVGILCSGLDSTDGQVIHEVFQPQEYNEGGAAVPTYSNEEALDAIIHVIQNNAMMVHYLDRYSWYNHFDPSYYTSGRYELGY